MQWLLELILLLNIVESVLFYCMDGFAVIKKGLGRMAATNQVIGIPNKKACH